MEGSELPDNLSTKKHKEVFGEIYKHLYQRIFFYCRSHTNNQHDAKDICQETFVRGYKALPRFKWDKGTVQAFFYQIARNLVIDFSRRKKELPLETVAEKPDDKDLFEDAAKKEQADHLHEEIRALPAKESRLIRLRYFEERSFQEIARMTKVGEGALRVQTHRILKKLRDNLETKFKRRTN